MPVREKDWSDRLNLIVNLAVLGILSFVLLRPDGVVGGKIVQHRDDVARRDAIAAAWPELVAGGARLDGGEVEVGLIEFADYQCPACRIAHDSIAALAESLEIGIVLRHLPLTQIHPSAEGAARASICAESFGGFESMNDRLYATTTWHEERDWIAEARAVGILDTTAFRSCLESEATSARVAADQALAERFDVRGTPTFVGQRGIFTGVPTKADLLKIIEPSGSSGG